MPRVLVVHNRYTERAGEDAVFDSEVELLRRAGVPVATFAPDNSALEGARGGAALSAVWSLAGAREVARRARELAADVVHFHNVQPQLSPAAFRAARATGAAVVATLHNYRTVCPGALLLRAGSACSDCVGRSFAWPAIVHGCYRDSRAASAVVTLSNAVHRAAGTFERHVDRFVALTAGARDVFVEGGLPARRIALKPNFVDAAPAPSGSVRAGILFVGRLTPEKGVGVLLDAHAARPELPLQIVGDGPLAPEVREAARRRPTLDFAGSLAPAGVRAAMEQARVLAFPSIWLEGMPRTLIEAFAAGLPVVGSDLGATAEMVAMGPSGVLVAPGDAAGLGRALDRLHAAPDRCRALGRAARREFEARWSPAANLEQLLAIYRDAIDERRGGRR